MLNVDYVVINELTKFKWKRTQLNNYFTYMLRKKSIRQNMIKIKSFELLNFVSMLNSYFIKIISWSDASIFYINFVAIKDRRLWMCKQVDNKHVAFLPKIYVKFFSNMFSF
jgi:hypothetical protein